MNVDLNKLHMKGAVAEEADGKWGMVIDMDICTGCQACVAACAMENNIAYVGEEDAGYGRSMHWIRTERFWEGEYPEVKMTDYQPMLCQQCGKAPCEPVCPAFATVHSQAEQINLQVYNRCVGTRHCGNNCPFRPDHDLRRRPPPDREPGLGHLDRGGDRIAVRGGGEVGRTGRRGGRAPLPLVRRPVGRSRARRPGGPVLEVSRVADREPVAMLVVKAEATVRWSQVDEVLALMRDAGARRVLLWTRPALAAGEGRIP